MTKMMDILEEFLVRKRFRYFRLDGSCNIADRRDMVNEFQTNPEIFAFILSTRAGGLGVTLTAADTVIFYDNDWNPTVDSQAADRAHRIGQQCDVEVFRLVLKDSIETRILKRAQQKQTVQATVYSGETFKADFQSQEVMKILMEETETVDMTMANEISTSFGKRAQQDDQKPAEGQESKKELNSFMNKGHLRRGKIPKGVHVSTHFLFF
jgi:chromatin-remodeling ATPase INO80